MKKKFLFITIALLTILINRDSVNAEDYSSYCAKNPTAPVCVCLANADGTAVKGTNFEFTYCYQLFCSSNTYKSQKVSTSYLIQPVCSNGNTDYFSTPKSTPYDNYIGKSCGLGSEDIYYNQTVTIDCTRKRDGSAYIPPTTTKKPQVPVIPQTTFDSNTTKAPTTTTTKKQNQTTQRVTFETIPVTTTTTAVTKPEVTISSTAIKKITINGIDTKYKSSKSVYDLKVPYGMSEVDVEVTLEDATSQVIVIGNTDMPDDDHSIHIIVTAENGETREVTFNIIRYTTLSNDCSLANIYSKSYNLDFTKSKKDYTLKVEKNVSSIDFEIIPTDEENATFTVSGNEKLRNKSVITIDVIAEDGTSCKYTIKIKKDSNTWKYILAIVLLVGVLATSSILLYRYLKKSKGKYKYE